MRSVYSVRVLTAAAFLIFAVGACERKAASEPAAAKPEASAGAERARKHKEQEKW
jgi:hypothetical protein